MKTINPSPRISLSNICRGNGKIYALLNVANAGATRLTVRSVICRTMRVPAEIVTLPSGQMVLVLTVLDKTQTVTIRAFDGEGKLVAHLETNIGRRSSQISSKVRTILRDSVVQQIRNCDTLDGVKEIECVSTRISLGYAGEPDRLQFAVRMALMEDEPTDINLNINAFHADGTKLADSEICVLGDVTLPKDGHSQRTYRYVCYSVPLWQWERSIAAWLTMRGPHPREAIVVVEPHVVDALRDDWGKRTMACENNPAYDAWFREHKTKEDELAKQRTEQRAFGIRPLFSIVVPLYHTPTGFLNDMAQSVLMQTYDNFELILVNSTPQDDDLTQAVSRLQDNDERIRVVTLDGNKGITENTNAGIEVATGDFVSFFDHDDLLEPDLLYWYVREINAFPNTDLLYCDEDKVEDGYYSYPFFKPNWSPLFLETNNYVCHLLTVRRSLLNQLPVATASFDGAQDHRLTLLAGLAARRVGHIDKMLYHWRIHSQSTAASATVKPESLEAGRKAVSVALEEQGVSAHAENVEGMPHYYRVVSDTTDKSQMTVVILNDGDEALVTSCAASFEHLADTCGCEVVVTPELGRQSGFSQAINETIRKARGEIIVLVSSRVRLANEESLDGLLTYASRTVVGVAGGRVEYKDGTKSRCALVLANNRWHVANRLLTRSAVGCRGLEVLAHECLAVSGDCIALRKTAFEQVGGISDDVPQSLWSIDLCLKMRENGLSIVALPDSLCVTDMMPADLDLTPFSFDDEWMQERMRDVLVAPDPYYSQHLSDDGYYRLDKTED